MTNYTFGSGGDYTDPYAAWMAIRAAGMADDVTCTQISDCTLSGNMVLFASTDLDTGGYTLKFTSNNPHNGNPNAGWQITIADANYIFGAQGDNWLSNCNFLFEDLKIVRTVASGNPTVYHSAGGIGFFSTAIFNRLIVLGQATFGMRVANRGGVNTTIKACKVYNTGGGNTCVDWSQGSSGLGDRIIENTTCYGGRFGFVENYSNGVSLSIIRNVVCCGQTEANPAAFVFNQAANCVIENCADDDGSLPASATGSQENIVPADEFISLTSTDNYFLFIPRTATLYNNGATTAYATTDITSEALPYLGDYPIGCHVGIYSKIVYLPEAVGNGKEYSISNTTSDVILVDADTIGSSTLDDNSTKELYPEESMSVVDYDTAKWIIV